MNYVVLYEITQGQFEYNGCSQIFFITKLLVFPQVNLVINILYHLHHDQEKKRLDTR
jgi:hypothetical protein